MAKPHNMDVEMPLALRDSAHEALVNFWWTGVIMKKVSSRFFRARGTSEGQFNLLRVLRDTAGPVTQVEISRRLLIDKPNVTTLLDKTQQAGLTRRRSVPGDRRSYNVCLTPAGKQWVDRLDETYHRVVATVMAEFSARQRADMIRLSTKLRAALAQVETDPQAKGR